MRNALLFVVGTILLVGWVFTPQRPGAEPLGRIATSSPARNSAEQRRIANYYAGATELDRAGDGHFYTAVEANGAKIDTVVDTGATVVALTAQDARAAGLDWSPADVRVIGTGASGPVRGVTVTLDRVSLGGHEARGVSAVIIPEGLQMSLLGQSFLATVDPLRIEGDRMLLGG